MTKKSEALEELAKLLNPGNRLSHWMPNGRIPTIKQHVLLSASANAREEVLYGGQVGGGKSDGLLMAALQYVDVPGYGALIIRKHFTDLEQHGALIPRSDEWLRGKATYNKNKHQWVFPSGATLTFGYIANDNDVQRYQSAEFQFIGFDELTQFNKFQYTYMMSRLRGPSEGPLSRVPIRMRSATNPGGRGHEWVKERFIDMEDEPEKRNKRAFISSGIADNPHLNVEGYRSWLAELDPATRRQLEEGDWDAREPGNWVLADPAFVDASVSAARDWLARDLIQEPERGMLSAGIDWGEYTQAYAIWPLPNGVIYIPPSEVVGDHEEPGVVSERIWKSVTKFGHPVSDWRYDAAGAQNMRTFMATARKRSVETGRGKQYSTKIAFSSYKRETMWYLRLLFRRVAEDEATRIILIHPDNKELIRQLKIWERKDDESEETTKEDDHGPDALVAGVAPIARKHRSWVESQVEESDVKVAA